MVPLNLFEAEKINAKGLGQVERGQYGRREVREILGKSSRLVYILLNMRLGCIASRLGSDLPHERNHLPAGPRPSGSRAFLVDASLQLKADIQSRTSPLHLVPLHHLSAMQTALTRLLAVRIPVVSAPMAGAAGGALAAAVTRGGGFAFVAAVRR